MGRSLVRPINPRDTEIGGVMPRNMSFAMTTKQAKAKTKDVTRRFGWWFLKEGS